MEARTLAFRLKTLGLTSLRAIEPTASEDGHLIMSAAVQVVVPRGGDAPVVVRDTLRDGQPFLQFGTPRESLGDLLFDIRRALEQEKSETDAIRRSVRGDA
jgi:hypothetical protein